jgi:benzoyl-CoA reductase subunit B
LVDNFLNDLETIIKDYNIQCVLHPGHMGHKDGSSSISLYRDKCRDLGVPFLSLGMDQFDKRYTTIDEMKDKISQFFLALGFD